MQKYSVFFLTAMSMVLIAVFSVRCSGVEGPASTGMPRVINGEAGSLLRPAKALPAFTLTDQYGEPFDNARLGGRWSLLFTGFASCRHLCPPTMFKMNMVAESVALPSGEALRLVFVSVDPERDSIEDLAEYAGRYSAEVVAVTGESSQLDALVGGLGATWKVTSDTDSYDVEHSPAIYLINPDGRFAGIFTPPLIPEKITADVMSYITQSD